MSGASLSCCARVAREIGFDKLLQTGPQGLERGLRVLPCASDAWSLDLWRRCRSPTLRTGLFSLVRLGFVWPIIVSHADATGRNVDT